MNVTQLFEDERINISAIKSVLFTNTKTESKNKKIIRYGYCNIVNYELIFNISAEGISHFDGHTLPYGVGSIIFLPKKTHAEYFVDCIKYGDCIDIFFDTTSPMPDIPLVISLNTPEVKSLFEQLNSVWLKKNTGYYTKAMQIFYKIINLIITKQNAYTPKTKLKQLQPAEDYLENNFLQVDFNCNHLAKLCNLSYSYFKKLFVLKYNIPPSQYVNQRKIEHAKEMLCLKQYSISTIAYTCGFESPYYFSATFKKIVGMSPSEYQKRHFSKKDETSPTI